MKIKNLMIMGLTFPMLFGLAGCDGNGKQIGILLPVEHPALQAAADGFVLGLKEAGLKEGTDFSIKVMNAGGKAADITSYAKQLVSESIMTLGVATDPAVALKSAAIDKGITNPVLFTAVTAPADPTTGLVESLENGKGFVTGTSDAQPIEAQIELIKECIPAADKIGILYTQSESNSVVQARDAKLAAAAQGLTVIERTVTGPGDISATALALASEEGIDAIYIPTDNNIAANTNAVKEAANSKNVLIVTGEEGMLKSGGHVTLSIDYTELGKRTGLMAAQILKGEKKAAEIPVGVMTKEECEYVYSSANLVGSGITLPASVIAKSRDVSAEN